MINRISQSFIIIPFPHSQLEAALRLVHGRVREARESLDLLLQHHLHHLECQRLLSETQVLGRDKARQEDVNALPEKQANQLR